MWRRREFAALFAVAVLASCTDAPPTTTAPAETASPEASLIEFAASDFRLHVVRDGAEFRNVHPGELRGGDGAARSLICGEFRRPGQEAWAAFATIRTDPYENWLGGSALGSCSGANTTLDPSRDLSAALAERYRAQE